MTSILLYYPQYDPYVTILAISFVINHTKMIFLQVYMPPNFWFEKNRRRRQKLKRKLVVELEPLPETEPPMEQPIETTNTPIKGSKFTRTSWPFHRINAPSQKTFQYDYKLDGNNNIKFYTLKSNRMIHTIISFHHKLLCQID